jgi:hypothetical protein
VTRLALRYRSGKLDRPDGGDKDQAGIRTDPE